MNKQSGIGLSEILISLFLATFIMSLLGNIYLNNKKQYGEAQKLLTIHLDLQWVSDLLSDSIRRAGFTPCLGINQLESIDSRNFKTNLQNLLMEPNLIQINRMNEEFSQLISIQNATQLIVSDNALFKVKHPILIADCEHAEVHQIIKVEKLAKANRITLAKPIVFSYATAYVGEWLEEKWFIKLNINKEKALYYKLIQTEEISSFIHSLHSVKQHLHDKELITLTMDVVNNETHQLNVVVRGS